MSLGQTSLGRISLGLLAPIERAPFQLVICRTPG